MIANNSSLVHYSQPLGEFQKTPNVIKVCVMIAASQFSCEKGAIWWRITGRSFDVVLPSCFSSSLSSFIELFLLLNSSA